ncbi:MAG TPA: tRNA (adenosine(37)-N6)-dimethylallyltransferase MiaA [Gaiellaceae bacterium]|jgi:tRNA dimethylallyltransferase|nr:tRNA (adenosine(37)-N6)-dimethylallyltransferase MiaA [Gaiellaceae bacterium]
MASSSPPAPAPRHVLALFGPTASGKTAVAGLLRDRLGGEVISVDSAALYAGVPVITAAPDYPARLVGVVPLEQDVSLGEYQRLAHAAIDQAEAPIVVGGSGLYLRAALSSLDLPPPPSPGQRERWQAEVERLGSEAAHALLAERDPAAAARVHPNDRKRLVRALELNESGRSLAPAADRLWTEDTRLPTTIVALDLPLDELDRRIEARTRAMVAAGAVEEARRAWARPLSHTAREIVGLEEFATLPVDEAVAAVAQATRRLARYQRKWLRRLPNVVTLDGNRSAEEVADEIVALGRAGERLSGRE